MHESYQYKILLSLLHELLFTNNVGINCDNI